MTHYNIDYTELEGKAKRAKALADMRDWLGPRFDTITTILRDEPNAANLEWLRMALSFAGVQGYPVEAYHEWLMETDK